MADPKDIITGTISSLFNKAKEVAESPSVRNAVDKVKAAAEDTVDKVKDAAENSSIRDVYDQGAARVKSYGRMAKLSLEINGDLEEMKRVYGEIGKLYYEQNREAPEGFFVPLFQQLEQIRSRVERDQAELEQLKSQPSTEDEPDISVEIVAETVEDAAEDLLEDLQEAAQELKDIIDATENEGSGEEKKD